MCKVEFLHILSAVVKLFGCIQVHWWLQLTTGLLPALSIWWKQQHTCHKCVTPPVKITKTGWLEVLFIVFKTANPDCVTQTYFCAQQQIIHHSYATNVLTQDCEEQKVLTFLHENYDLSDLQSLLVFFAAEPNYMFLEWWVAVSF